MFLGFFMPFNPLRGISVIFVHLCNILIFHDPLGMFLNFFFSFPTFWSPLGICFFFFLLNYTCSLVIRCLPAFSFFLSMVTSHFFFFFFFSSSSSLHILSNSSTSLFLSTKTLHLPYFFIHSPPES